MIRFLLFNGQWENECVFSALETEDSLLIMASGYNNNKDSNINAQQISLNYLQKNKQKIKGIIVANTSYRNICGLEELLIELKINTYIYTSYYSKIILENQLKKIKLNIKIVENKEYVIDDFIISFLSCNSYIIGNLIVACYYKEYSFHFIEDFYFSSLLNNNLFNHENFFPKLQGFLSNKKEHSYLITSLSNISWHNDNSLFFAKNYFSVPFKDISFFIFYDFDWLRIIELLELANSLKKTVIVIDLNFFNLLKKVLSNNHLKKVITYYSSRVEDNIIYLLTVNLNAPTHAINIIERICESEKKKINFILGLPILTGQATKLAQLWDYLYTHSNKINNLGKTHKKYFRLGTSLSDLKMILDSANFNAIIILNNSYKNKDILTYITTKKILLNNNHFFNFVDKNTNSFINNKQTLISLEEILIEQKQKLQQNGLLLVCLTTKRINNNFILKDIHLEKVSIPFIPDDMEKLHAKIVKWWDIKLTSNITDNDNNKIVKTVIERRLNNLIQRFINYEYGKEINEVPVLLFFLKDSNKEQENNNQY